MSAPPKLFENGPEWVPDLEDWMLDGCSVFLFRVMTMDGPRWSAQTEIGESAACSPSGSMEQAIAWLRSRILERRDQLNRIAPPAKANATIHPDVINPPTGGGK